MSVTPDQIQAVYDFENIIADAVAIAPALAHLNPATQNTVSLLQKPRPRTEILFKINGEVVPRRMIGPKMLNGAYKGTLVCVVITGTDTDDKKVHTSYVTQLRFLMPNIGPSLNGTILTNHCLQFIRETGTTLLIKNDEGYLQTSINFDVDFTIQSNALNALQT